MTLAVFGAATSHFLRISNSYFFNLNSVSSTEDPKNKCRLSSLSLKQMLQLPKFVCELEISSQQNRALKLMLPCMNIILLSHATK